MPFSEDFDPGTQWVRGDSHSLVASWTLRIALVSFTSPSIPFWHRPEWLPLSLVFDFTGRKEAKWMPSYSRNFTLSWLSCSATAIWPSVRNQTTIAAFRFRSHWNLTDATWDPIEAYSIAHSVLPCYPAESSLVRFKLAPPSYLNLASQLCSASLHSLAFYLLSGV